MSMVENLDNIERLGIKAFIKNEKTRWACPECGGIICIHRRFVPHVENIKKRIFNTKSWAMNKSRE
jgi:hypothetical protein